MTTDKKAIFDDEYRRYYEKCLLFARSYTHDLSLSEDIVVESMIVLWRRLQEPGGLEGSGEKPVYYASSTCLYQCASFVYATPFIFVEE